MSEAVLADGLGRLGAVLAAVALTACGGDPEPAPVPRAAEIVAAARERGVARVRVTSTTTVEGVQVMSATGTGLLDVAGARSSLRVAYDAGARRLGLKPVEEVAAGDVVHLRQPGRRWFHAPVEPGDRAVLRPYAAVAAVAAVTTLAPGGEEAVAGQPAVRYAGAAPACTVEVWVAGDGAPVRFRLRHADGVTTTVDVERWGVPERVAVPARSTAVETSEDLYEAVLP